MSIYGNMAGGNGAEKSFILQTEDGAEVVGIVVDKETVFTATPNDIREGKIAGTEQGVTTGDKVIPAYHTTETARYISEGSKFIIPLPDLDKYDYTKLQVIICAFNTSTIDSVAAQKVSILDKVYDVNSTEVLATVIKDAANKTIDLGITNDSGSPCVMRCFTYKEIY